jgi:hypothetical protein
MGLDESDPARLEQRLERNAGGPGGLVFETDVHPGHRRTAAAKHFEALAACHAVGNQDGAALHRADLDRPPRELFHQADRLSGTDHVADLNRALQRQSEA